MTPIAEMTDEQFEQHALSVLERELGPLGFARYLRAHGGATGDYTRDRDQWLGRLSFEELLDRAKNVKIPAAE